MDLDKHLPQLDAGFRAALTAMTDPDPDKRPQRARDVVALLAKSRAAEGPSGARSTQGSRTLAPRRMFADIQEPLGTLLRLGVLGFGAGGWVGMAGDPALADADDVDHRGALVPARASEMTGVGRELDSMLAEGQSGFTDMMRAAMARQR